MSDYFAHLEDDRVTRDPAKLEGAAVAAFALAGNATFTVQSRKTGTRFTYRVSYPRDKETGKVDRTAPLFVSVLTGPENTRDYTYLGYIRRDLYLHGKKSRISADAPSAIAFEWFFRAMTQNRLEACEVFHNGHCGRCGRVLTVPESIRSGIGPECAKKGDF